MEVADDSAMTPDRPAHWQASVQEAIRQAEVNLRSVDAPAEMPVLLGPGWRESCCTAVGHGLEGDFNRKKTSAFAGLMGSASRRRE